MAENPGKNSPRATPAPDAMAAQAWAMAPAPGSNTFVILNSLFDIRYSSAYPFPLFPSLLRYGKR